MTKWCKAWRFGHEFTGIYSTADKVWVFSSLLSAKWMTRCGETLGFTQSVKYKSIFVWVSATFLIV
jgi:hypothetical protein